MNAFHSPRVPDLTIALATAIALLMDPVRLRAAGPDALFEPQPLGLMDARVNTRLPDPVELVGPAFGGVNAQPLYWLRLRMDSAIATPAPAIPSLIAYPPFKFVLPQSFGNVFWADLNRKFTSVVVGGKFNFNIGYQF